MRCARRVCWLMLIGLNCPPAVSCWALLKGRRFIALHRQVKGWLYFLLKVVLWQFLNRNRDRGFNPKLNRNRLIKIQNRTALIQYWSKDSITSKCTQHASQSGLLTDWYDVVVIENGKLLLLLLRNLYKLRRILQVTAVEQSHLVCIGWHRPTDNYERTRTRTVTALLPPTQQKGKERKSIVFNGHVPSRVHGSYRCRPCG